MKTILFVVHYVELFLGVFTFVSLVFQFTVGQSVFVPIGAWRNRQAARRTSRLLYRVATRCPLCGHDAGREWKGDGLCAVMHPYCCMCPRHGRSAVLPQPPAPECWQ